MKTWWAALSEEDKTAHFRKWATVAAGQRRRFDEISYVEKPTCSISAEEAEVDRFAAWEEYVLRGPSWLGGGVALFHNQLTHTNAHTSS